MLRAGAIPDTRKDRESRLRGRYGATIFEIIDPLNARRPLHYLRTINAVNDGGRWIFSLQGTEQPFERPESYRARLIREKFTPGLLDQYLRAMGIRLFEADFYLPKGTTAILVHLGNWAGTFAESISLEDLQIESEGHSPFVELIKKHPNVAL